MKSLSGISEIRTVPIVVHEKGEDAAILYLNDSFLRSFGYSLADIPDLSVWGERAYPDPAYRNEAYARWCAEIEARQTTDVVAPPGEYRLVDGLGRERDVLIGFALHGDLVIVTFQDLTETRAAEAALEAERREKEQTAFALTENMPAGAYTKVLRPGAQIAEFSFLSTQFLNMMGLEREEALGDPMKVYAGIHPEDRPEWIERSAEAVAKRLPFSGETRIVVNGETRWVRAESVPRALEDGSIIWEGVLVDINPLKRAEQELQTVLEAARAYTWRRDLVTRQSEFDGRWAELAGHALDVRQIRGDDWILSVHPDDRKRILAAVTALENGEVENDILTYRRKLLNGDWLWLQVHAGVSERDAMGQPVALSGVSFDITHQMTLRAQAQEEQAQLREELQRAQQRDTVSQIAGGIAHELNNLIAVVAGTAEMLRRQAAERPELLSGIDRIRRTVDIARDLITGLGGLVRPDLPRGSHDLGKLLQNAVDLLGQRRIARHAIGIDLADEPSLVWANPTEVMQVVVNLAINACDSGTTETPATVHIQALPAGSTPPPRPPDVGTTPDARVPSTLFTIQDTGAGITDETRRRMFRPNFTTKGTGLGLLIVSSILMANRAAMWVDSVPGAGTTVTLAWPSIDTVDPSPRSRRDQSQASDSDQPTGLLDGMQVLVVDDMSDAADVLAEMLEAAGAVAVAIDDPIEAAQILAEAPTVWSVLLTDLHMPQMDGVSLARHAAGLTPPVPAVLVTARSDMLDDISSADFAAILSKPVTSARLAQAVRLAKASKT